MRTFHSWIAAGLLALSAMPVAASPRTSGNLEGIEGVARQELEAALADSSSWTTAPKTAAAAPATAYGLKAAGFRCLPSCAENDGRFLAVAAGASLVTLSEASLDVQVSAPAGVASFQLGIFDGDADSANTNWDVGAAPFSYTVYADPDRDGSGMTVVAGPFASSAMPNNAWFDFVVPTGPEAQTPSGNFFYRLRIENLDPALVVLNSFKLRSDGVVTIEVQQQPFGFYAALQSQQDALIVFPNFPTSPTPTTYDGSFDFFLDVKSQETDLVLWGGDLDRGSFDGTSLDTDDPDTPNAPFLPSWATDDAVPEGVAVGLPGTTGNPADDTNPAGLGVFLRRTPAIFFEVMTPEGVVFVNDNPSGNQEWEKFQLTTLGPLDPTVADRLASALPAGTYRIRANGVDMQNLNFWRFFHPLLCVDEVGAPCTPLRPFLVGDQIWLDFDSDGIFDAGEPGIDGVLVELLDNDGDVIASTLTSAGGLYGFEVDAGSFSVRVAASNFEPGGVLETLTLTTAADELSTTIIDDNDLDLDFGYVGPGEIGDLVWLDYNGDGFPDFGEPGIEGVTLILRDDGGNVVATTVTGPDGSYLFSGLAPGIYSVEVDAGTLPPGLNPTYDFDGTDSPNLVVDIELGGSEGAPASNLFIDFGYAGTGAIGDRVWEDLNGNGIQDGGEPGIIGAVVYLYDADDNLLTIGFTGFDGLYSFENLVAGTYRVEVEPATIPAGLLPTFDLDGVGTPNSAIVALGDGEINNDVDFGYGVPAANGSIGDLVWLDLNADGFPDATEPGIPGVTLTLRDSGGNVVGVQVTGPDGSYLFDGLPAGIYSVEVDPATLPPATNPTYDFDGTDTPHLVTDIEIGGAEGGPESNLFIDFGYAGTGVIGDLVWVDLDGDGIQDGGEAGIVGVVVYLYDGDGNLLNIAFTDGDGLYRFENLLAGTYRVDIEPATLPAGLQPAYDLDGIATPNSATLTLATGQVREDVDFGYNGNASLGDRVWLDFNGDGVQDAGEPGLAGVTVELVGGGGTVLATAVTDGDGLYGFANLVAGTYTVRVDAATLPAGVSATFDFDGIATLHTADVSLATGESNDLLDFGYVGAASLGDLVWIDLDGDGFQGPGEDGIDGVTVRLFDAGGNLLATTVTTGGGFYGFANLPGGTYTVAVDPATLPAGLNPAYDLDGVGTPHTAVATVAAGASNDEVDFGYNGDGFLGDLVWRDDDANGVQDGGEPGLAGVPVSLLNGSGVVIATTVTDANGLYGFSNLVAGTYTVVVDAAAVAALEATYDLDGIASANTATVTLATGGSNSDVDFGYRSPVVAGSSLGDRVWLDSDGDGVQDAGEPGIVGVTVYLLDATDTVIDTTITGADGVYSFGGLAAGVYTVVVDHTTTGQAVIQTYDLDGIDSPHRAQVALGEAEDRTDLDFGYVDEREICAVEAEKPSDTHAIWLPGIGTQFYFEPPAVFTENADGTATLTGTAVDITNPARIFYVQASLTGRTAVTPPGSPKKELPASQYKENGGPIDTATWYYYTGLTGTLVGDGELAGAVLDIQRVGPAWQVGFGANNKNLLYGASSWFTWTVAAQPSSGETLPNGQGDFNLELVDCVTSSSCLPVLDFDEDAFGDKLAPGTLVGEQWAALGIHISTNDPVNHPLMIFDSSNPTGGDPDLGTPNQDFGGPGIGSGGQAGTPGVNRYPLGNLLIISEDGDQNDPDDNAGGGTITFDFDQPVDVYSVKLVDIDVNEPAAVRAYDADGVLIAEAGMLNRGDNSVQDVVIEATGVRRLEVTFPGSGAIADVVFCQEEEPPVPCGACDGKVTELTLEYLGSSMATIEVFNRGGDVLLFSGDILPGEEFTVFGFDRKGTLGTEIKVYVNGQLNTKIHTSCSQPIGPGLIKGDFLVVAGESRNGGALCPVDGGGGDPDPECGACDGKVTTLTLEYLGSSAAKVEVFDRRDQVLLFSGDVAPGEEFTVVGFDNKGTLGTEIKIYVNEQLNTKIHTSCSQPIGPGLISGDFIVVEGASRNGGALCPLDGGDGGGGGGGGDPDPECGACDGKVTTLTLEYLGSSTAKVEVFDRRDQVLLFSGDVDPGDELTVVGFDNKGTLGTEIKIYVNEQLNTKIHTSCSQPIGPGLISGDFIVVEGASRNGGPLCPL